MAAPSVSSGPARSRDLDASAYRMHGIVAGLGGAALLAAWFLFLDVLRGRPLYTPTLLAQVLFSGAPHPGTADAVEGEVLPTVLFTFVHALAFAAIGLAVAEFVRIFDLAHSRALMVVLLFGAMCIAFFGFGVMFAAVGPHAIPVRDAFVGNALASIGMAVYLGRALGRERPL